MNSTRESIATSVLERATSSYYRWALNGAIGSLYWRPPVGSLSAIVVAILLYASNHANAQAPPGIGIMYLTSSDRPGDPIHNWTNDPALTNPFVQGIALRTQWGRVEPHEHANANDFYWDFLDQGVALSAAYGKKVSILVTAGVTTPQWVYDAGAPAFNVTEQYGYSSITDGITTAGSTTVRSAGDTALWNSSYSTGLKISGGSIPDGATIVAVNSSSNVTISVPATQSATGVAVVTAQIAPMPLPWDPVFQAKWGAFVQAFAARYGNTANLVYVVMGGPGRRAEAYFCFTPGDMDYFINTLGGLPKWEQGVRWIIDQYGAYFPNTPFILDMASPIPTSDGDASLKAMVDYGAAQYPGNHFGVKADGLEYPSGPPNGSNGATQVTLLSPTSTVGYQFSLPQGGVIDPPTGRLLLDLGLERGIGFGAHFIEVYAQDCDDPLSAAVLTSAGTVLTTTPPIPTAPSSLTTTSTSSATIDLRWIDNANNEIGQRIERSVGSNANYAFLTNAGPNITAVTDSALLDGIQYYYRVQAFNTGGFSTFSNEQSAITPLNSPSSLSATAVSSSQITVTWTDNASTETGFKIELSPVDNLHYAEIATVGPNVTAYTNSGLSEATKYYYRVRAYNAIAASGYTSEKKATTFSNIPVAPSGLTITSLLSNQVSLSWADKANNETGFKIQRKQGVTGTYVDIKTTSADVASYKDNDPALRDGTLYYYRVSATNSAGDSAFSNEASGTTALTKPTSSGATAISSSRIDLTWIDNSASETGYKIERKKTASGSYSQIAQVGANVQSYSDTNGLDPNTKYYYRSRATNGTLNSEYSNEPSAVTVLDAPAAPSNLTITSVLQSAVSLSWTDNANNETGFKIQRKQGVTGTYVDIKTTSANVTSYSDNDAALRDGTLYYYRVSATNSTGDSAFSNEASGTTALAKPTSAGATAISSSRIDLTWIDNSASETGYKIERKKTASGSYSQIVQVGANVKSYSDASGLDPNTKYYYRVRATNGTLNSEYSNEPFAVTSLDAPAVPSNLAITSVLQNSVSLSWKDNADNETGFKIQRKQGVTGTYADIKTTSANATSYNDNDAALKDGTLYYYRVSATNSTGDSAFSNEASGTTTCAKPTSAGATAISSSRIDLTWVDNSASETGYKIERKKTASGSYSQIVQVGANVKSYSDASGLDPNTRYYYRVRGTNGTLNSEYSNEPFAVTFK